MSKFDKEVRKEFVWLLEQAKQRLWDGVDYSGEAQYICCAIPDHYHYSEKLRREIESRLEGFGTIRGWLAWKLQVPSSTLESIHLQAHRKAWIDLLIKEFSAP